ncbi:MAG: lysylphosphatidylglycerol synthase transmembrane domain-containing protein [Myxococcales bacterium]|nr:lysylphosphatidylglycerol synthase transmembrane domain-containing protein [Myxococcales bacterium]
MSRTARTLVGIVISIVALYLAMPPRDEWGNVAAAFARVRYAYLVPIALISAYSVVVRCQRWRLLLRPVGDIPFLPLFSATSVGFFCNMVLPLRVGEVIRPVLLANRTNVPVSSVLASVLLERLLDMLTILVFLGLVMCLVPVSATIRQSGIAFLVIAIFAVVMIALLQRRHPRALGFLRWILSCMPAGIRDRAEAALESFIDGLQGIGTGAALLQILGYSVCLWVVIASIFGVGFFACDLDVPLVSGSLALVTVVAGAVSAPSAPGFIGTFQAGCVVALGLFAVSRADAIPYAFVVWAAQWLTQVVLGVVFLLRENIRFAEVRAAEEPAP